MSVPVPETTGITPPGVTPAGNKPEIEAEVEVGFSIIIKRLTVGPKIEVALLVTGTAAAEAVVEAEVEAKGEIPQTKNPVIKGVDIKATSLVA